MPRTWMLLLAALALAAPGVVRAGRMDPEAMMGAAGASPLSTAAATAGAASSAMAEWLLSNQGREKDIPAYVAFRYYVEPSKKEDFVKLWLTLEEETVKEKGVKIFDLKKSMSDNSIFLGYGEWESIQDSMDHYKSQYVRDFLKGLKEQDIGYTIIPLAAPDVTEVTPKKGDKTDDKDLVHVIVRYTVAPSQAGDFEKLWDAAAKGVEGEEGSHIYSLRRVFETNWQFYTYGTWDSWKAYHSHFDSKHIHQFLGELDRRDITWSLSPLHKVGHQPE